MILSTTEKSVNHPEDLALSDLEAHAVDGDKVPISLAQVFDEDSGDDGFLFRKDEFVCFLELHRLRLFGLAQTAQFPYLT